MRAPRTESARRTPRTAGWSQKSFALWLRGPCLAHRDRRETRDFATRHGLRSRAPQRARNHRVESRAATARRRVARLRIALDRIHAARSCPTQPEKSKKVAARTGRAIFAAISRLRSRACPSRTRIEEFGGRGHFSASPAQQDPAARFFAQRRLHLLRAIAAAMQTLADRSSDTVTFGPFACGGAHRRTVRL